VGRVMTRDGVESRPTPLELPLPLRAGDTAGGSVPTRGSAHKGSKTARYGVRNAFASAKKTCPKAGSLVRSNARGSPSRVQVYSPSAPADVAASSMAPRIATSANDVTTTALPVGGSAKQRRAAGSAAGRGIRPLDATSVAVPEPEQDSAVGWRRPVLLTCRARPHGHGPTRQLRVRLRLRSGVR
jgi:hypothetical protein